MFLTFLFIFTILYVIKIGLFVLGAIAARYSSDRSLLPSVSVVVCARNEEHQLRSCLDSLLSLNYPEEFLEIVIVDDRSTDSTPAIIAEYAARSTRVRSVTSEPSRDHLRGKANALAQGIEKSRGEILLFTDADCVVPSGWVAETVKYYSDPRTGIVAGFTAIRARDWFETMQALDWYALFSVAAATARLGFPVTAVGNNLSVRRVAYTEVGGFRGIPFSITEDYALVHAIVTRTRYTARFPMDRGQLVETAPCRSWRELHHQKKRWFTGGRDMDPKSIAILSIAYIFSLLLLLSPFILGFGPFLAALATKLVLDALLLLPPLVRFGQVRQLFAFPAYAVYYFCYVLCYPPLVLLAGEVRWKEQSFTRNDKGPS